MFGLVIKKLIIKKTPNNNINRISQGFRPISENDIENKIVEVNADKESIIKINQEKDKDS